MYEVLLVHIYLELSNTVGVNSMRKSLAVDLCLRSFSLVNVFSFINTTSIKSL